MNMANDLELALNGLFSDGADEEHDEDEMIELLEGVDFHALVQTLCNEAMIVFQYQAYGDSGQDFEYYGPLLFPAGAVRLWEDDKDCTNENALCRRSLELWLLPDLTFAVTSCFQVTAAHGAYNTAYRTYKGRDWRAAGMDIDFVLLANDLEDKCAGVSAETVAIYEM